MFVIGTQWVLALGTAPGDDTRRKGGAVGNGNEDLLAGRYLVGEVLGSGGAARVHRAWDTRLGRPVAVKTFRGVPDPVELQRFDNEGHTMATLSHPVLVEVYDSGVDGSRPYIVLQLIEGRTLRNRIADGPLPVAETARLGGRLAEALAYVHAQGVTHRDIKPSNVLLDQDGLPYLTDFGVARLTGSRRITESNQMVGTAAYLAPEQVRGSDVDTPADVYALGLVLIECLTGVPEYQGSDIESAVARLHRPPAVPQHLPDELALLLTRMTALNPRRRPSAREVADSLAGASDPTLAEFDLLPWSDERYPTAPTRRLATAAPRRPFAMAAAGLVAVAGFAAWSVSGTAASVSPPAAVPESQTTTPTATTPTTTTTTPAPPVAPSSTTDQQAPPRTTAAPPPAAPDTTVVVVARDTAADNPNKGRQQSGRPVHAADPRKGKPDR